MFQIKSKKENKRVGTLKTKHGVIDTPFFMPDATRGFVRSLDKNVLEEIEIGPMVVNTYHLYLNPGMKLIKKAGGVHSFMNFKGPLLSDSGGYQVFSLIHKNPKMGKITDKEVVFRSSKDGSLHRLTPEKAIQIQFDLGVDMMVVLDDPPPNNYSKEKIKKAVERTIKWAARCKKEYLKQIAKRSASWRNKKSKQPLIFGVIQGGEYLDLRKYCTEELVKIGFHGYGFGARHVDAEGNFLEEVLQKTASFIPENALRFALGVGTPEDIVKCFSYGWDMFDCVIPTREGRHGRLFIRDKQTEITNYKLQMTKKIPASPVGRQNPKNKFYETININNGKYKSDFSPVDEHCDCVLCQSYSKSYLHHLFSSKDPLAMRLASIHNLKFYMDLLDGLRKGA